MAATHRAPASAPAEDQLRLAYSKLARAGWPPSFEAAMAHSTYGVCITAAARNPHGACRPVDAAQAGKPSQPAAPVQVAPTHRGVDRKRLAANDKDD